MPDPLAKISDDVLRAQLTRIRELTGETKESLDLRSEIQGFKSQKGIFKPHGSPYALWIRQTSRGVYPDRDIDVRPDGSWSYLYSPESRNGRTDLNLATNQGLLKCSEDGIPVGVFRQTNSVGGQAEYEILGLAYVTSFDGAHFVLTGEPIDWSEDPLPESVVPKFIPFEPANHRESLVSRLVRDQRFGVAIRRAYHERCALCEIGFRLRGRPLALDAAHIIPIDHEGIVGDVRNGVLLCKNHHALFDSYAWAFDEDLQIHISPDREFREAAAMNHILNYEGARLRNLPSREEDYPASEAIGWRLAEFEKASPVDARL